MPVSASRRSRGSSRLSRHSPRRDRRGGRRGGDHRQPATRIVHREDADRGIGEDGDPGLPGCAANGDDETVARHTLCGLFDAVKEKRADLALADLTSDAFRKQFGNAEVTSIDKMVSWSPTQAQVLFTMRVDAGERFPRNSVTERRRAGHRPTVVTGQRGPGVLVPAAHGRPVLTVARQRRCQLNESPQAHEPVAFGLSMVKPCFSMVSTKSMVAPWMYGALIRSTVKPDAAEFRRSGRRRGCGRRRTGCSAGRRIRPAARRSAAPGRRGPPGPAAPSPWPRPHPSGSRRGCQSLGLADSS